MMILRSFAAVLTLGLASPAMAPPDWLAPSMAWQTLARTSAIQLQATWQSGPWDGSRPRFHPPVDAPVADPFRAPSGPYGPGNRGIEYATGPGARVAAIGDGVVAFAGPVAGRGVVSIDHPSGLRSTYTGLGEIVVSRGDPVDRGSTIGSTVEHLHLGLRDGRVYLDPAAFFGGAPAVLIE